MPSAQLKVVLIGPENSGKSTLMQYMKSNEVRTPGPRPLENMATFNYKYNNKEIQVNIWDPVANNKFVTPVPDFYKTYFFGADAYILLLRNDDIKYTHLLSRYLQETSTSCNSCVLLAFQFLGLNKVIPTEDDSQIDLGVALEFSRLHHCKKLYAFNALNGIGVNEMLEDIVYKVCAAKQESFKEE